MKQFIGHRKYLDATEMKLVYQDMRDRDYAATKALQWEGIYNEAIYMYIQAMEKQIKAYICGKVNATNPYFSQKLRNIGHSLDNSIDFLIELLAGHNEVLKEQLTEQIKTGVFQNVKFSKLYNDCRYPSYNSFKEQYFILQLEKRDCERVADICEQLTKFIQDFDRIR